VFQLDGVPPKPAARITNEIIPTAIAAIRKFVRVKAKGAAPQEAPRPFDGRQSCLASIPGAAPDPAKGEPRLLVPASAESWVQPQRARTLCARLARQPNDSLAALAAAGSAQSLAAPEPPLCPFVFRTSRSCTAPRHSIPSPSSVDPALPAPPPPAPSTLRGLRPAHVRHR
jgi:hypothetical protein